MFEILWLSEPWISGTIAKFSGYGNVFERRKMVSFQTRCSGWMAGSGEKVIYFEQLIRLFSIFKMKSIFENVKKLKT